MNTLLFFFCNTAFAGELDFFANRDYAARLLSEEYRKEDKEAYIFLRTNARVYLNDPNEPTYEKITEEIDFVSKNNTPYTVWFQTNGPRYFAHSNHKLVTESIQRNFSNKNLDCQDLNFTIYFMPKSEYKKLEYPDDIFYSLNSYDLFLCDDCDKNEKRTKIDEYVKLLSDNKSCKASEK